MNSDFDIKVIEDDHELSVVAVWKEDPNVEEFGLTYLKDDFQVTYFNIHTNRLRKVPLEVFNKLAKRLKKEVTVLERQRQSEEMEFL